MISSSEGSASGGDLMNLMRELISLREKVRRAGCCSWPSRSRWLNPRV